VPIEIEPTEPPAEDSVMSTLTKKTVKVSTAYTAYKLPDEVKVTKKEEPLPPPQMPFFPPMGDMLPPFPLPPFPMHPFPMPPFGGYEAPEIINAGTDTFKNHFTTLFSVYGSASTANFCVI
jgi:hypothetical protein